jgi:hypothetical protein
VNPDPHDDRLDEGAPLPFEEEATSRGLGTVRLVDMAPSHGSIDTAWHPELAPGMKCPQCHQRQLKRHKNTVYCDGCRLRWWSRRPQ